ncbi:hypothetical protein [Marinifilum fragile]|uniref:hypothetical protein n=1 Tax=Marinifilum fragile TaxID=570161 RepID=UPI002AA8D1E2|nr:hypothetical protein [Marinifilum fragile]
MKKIGLFILFALSCCQMALGQQESFGEFTYYEQVDGQKKVNTSMPYQNGSNWMTIKLQSGYGCTMLINKREPLLKILESINNLVIDKKTLIGEYKPCSVFKEIKSEGHSISNSVKISFYFDGKKLIISFPKLYDEFYDNLGKTCKVPGHTFYIPKENIGELIDCLKANL